VKILATDNRQLSTDIAFFIIQVEQMAWSEATLVLPLIISDTYHRGSWKGRSRKRYQKLFPCQLILNFHGAPDIITFLPVLKYFSYTANQR